MTSVFRVAFVILLACLFCVSAAQAGGIKKWVDENGVVHYGTNVPPQFKDLEHSELNRRGIEVRRVDRAKTEKEIERDKALEALRAEQRQLLEEQQERDRILLSLYRNEDDLVMARDGKVAQLDGQIRLNHAEIRRLKSRLSDFQAAAAVAERRGRQMTTQQQANLDSTQRSIEKSYAMILSREDEKLATLERYDYDLVRFRTLHRGAARAANADVIAESEFPDLVDTAVRCRDTSECSRLWSVAQSYARQHATTPIDLAADRILVTAPPRDLRDISVTVSRLADGQGDGARIFMDVQCAQFTEGREFCRGPQLSAIRTGFRDRLTAARSEETP